MKPSSKIVLIVLFTFLVSSSISSSLKTSSSTQPINQVDIQSQLPTSIIYYGPIINGVPGLQGNNQSVVYTIEPTLQPLVLVFNSTEVFLSSPPAILNNTYVAQPTDQSYFSLTTGFAFSDYVYIASQVGIFRYNPHNWTEPPSLLNTTSNPICGFYLQNSSLKLVLFPDSSSNHIHIYNTSSWQKTSAFNITYTNHSISYVNGITVAAQISQNLSYLARNNDLLNAVIIYEAFLLSNASTLSSSVSIKEIITIQGMSLPLNGLSAAQYDPFNNNFFLSGLDQNVC